MLQVSLSEKENIDRIMLIIGDAKEYMRACGLPQWQGDYPNKEMLLKDIKENASYSFFLDDDLVGIASLFEHEPNYENPTSGSFSNLSYFAIHRIAIKKEYRGKGYSKEIYQFIFSLAKKKGIESIRVDTHPKNTSMHSSLLKMGFVQCGYVNSKHETDGIRYIYEKIL